MSSIPRRLTEQVIERAGNRCEYCLLSQVGQEATFHIDHVKPRINGGLTTLDNLALACVSCSLRKWAKESAIDPETGKEEYLFNPRNHQWSDHFCWENETLISRSSIGRTTIAALALNRSIMLSIRIEEAERGRHPAQTDTNETQS